MAEIVLSSVSQHLPENDDDFKDKDELDDGPSETDDCDICENIGFATASLAELRPSLEENIISSERSCFQSVLTPFRPFLLSDPASIYVSIVREKFPKAQDQLVERLGEANWQRHNMVRRQESVTQKHIEEPEIGSVFHPYSAFHDSGIGTSVREQSQHAPSHTSFISSNTDESSRSFRVPPVPADACSGKAFQCSICGLKVNNIYNRVQWKYVTSYLFSTEH